MTFANSEKEEEEEKLRRFAAFGNMLRKRQITFLYMFARQQTYNVSLAPRERKRERDRYREKIKTKLITFCY